MAQVSDAAVRRTRLESGLRVVTERLPDLRSASVGFWVDVGAREEGDEEHGASHFLEHLLFKGTGTRTAADIAEAIESVGGDMNAFTAQELTAFTVRVPDERLPLALEVLADIMWRPSLRADDVEAERHVILEEIRMRDDTPDDLVHDVIVDAAFPSHPLGRPVVGTPASIEAMSREAIARYHAARYRPANVVVAAAGNVVHDEVVGMVEAGLPESAAAAASPVTSRTPAPLGPARPVSVVTRDTEQAHLVVGMRGLPRSDDDRYALAVLDQVLGGGMSSRLFQEVRERRGLAYAVYSYRAAYLETGLLAMYAGTAPEHVPELLEIVDTQLDRLTRDGGVATRELEAAKGHLKGSLALSLESSASRMHRIGRSELTLGEIPSLDELAARIDAVGPDDVARVVARVVSGAARCLAVVGPFEDSDFADRAA